MKIHYFICVIIAAVKIFRDNHHNIVFMTEFVSVQTNHISDGAIFDEP